MDAGGELAGGDAKESAMEGGCAKSEDDALMADPFTNGFSHATQNVY
jgi:hypothetical protein